jgi:hypothetical protein
MIPFGIFQYQRSPFKEKGFKMNLKIAFILTSIALLFDNIRALSTVYSFYEVANLSFLFVF